VMNKTDNVLTNVSSKRVRVTVVAEERQLSVTYSEYMPIVSVIQHAMCMRRIVSCGLPSSAIFLHSNS